MDLSKLDSDLDKITACETLKSNIRIAFEKFDIPESVKSMDQAMSVLLDSLSKIEPMGIYDGDNKELFRENSIGSEFQSETVDFLEGIAVVYCLISIYPIILPDISADIDKLKKISRAAKKLRELLPAQTDDLFGIIKTIDGIERLNLRANNTDEFFKNLDVSLQALEIMESQISVTVFGQLTKVRSKSPKGNMPIRTYISLVYDLWTRILGRSFIYDGPYGCNGVSRFTDFTFEALSALHPSIEHSQIEYAVRVFRNPPDDAHAFLKPKI